MRDVVLNTVNWETCKKELSPMTVTKRMTCAGYNPGGRDTCNVS